MVKIDFKDLCVFEQLLKDKCERLARGVELTRHAKDSNLFHCFETNFIFYSSLYEDISKKIINYSMSNK